MSLSNAEFAASPTPSVRPLSIFTAPGGARAVSVSSRSTETIASDRRLVLVCQGASCRERGGAELLQKLQARANAGEPLAISTASCLNSCPTGPNCMLAGATSLRTGITSGELPRLLGELATCEVNG